MTDLDLDLVEIPDPPGEANIGAEASASFGVAGWTLFSRATGLLRIAVAGGILGPTFFANIFQATNTVPNLTYNLMAGSVLTALVVPVLVTALDDHGIERARELMRHLVGLVVVGFVIAAAAVIFLSPVIVRLLTLGVGDADKARAHTECLVLLFLVLPQIGLYGLIAVSVAAQNARGHFTLPAAAPALENLGLIVTLVLVSVIFGSDTHHVSHGYLVFLGVGATLAVALHAALQCYGAARAGLPLWPGWDWQDPVVRALSRRLVPAAGTATLDAGWMFVVIVAAGTVPGGVVALQVGIQFYYLPVALSAKAVGAVLLPRLSREASEGRLAAFRETYERGISWSWFIAVPAALTLLLNSQTIARTIAFGQMRDHNGIALLSAAIASLSIALLGATMYEFAKQADYSRHKVIPPLVGCALMLGMCVVGSVVSPIVTSGPGVLVGCGLAITAGELTRAFICDRAARQGTRAGHSERLRNVGRHAGVALVTIAPAAVIGRFVGHTFCAHLGHFGAFIGVCVAVGGGLLGYVLLQSALNAPELPPRLHLAGRRARESHAG